MRVVLIALVIALCRASVARAATSTDPIEQAPEEDASSFSTGAEWAVDSQFVWRGMALSAGPIVEPSVYASVHGLTLSWSAVAPMRAEPTASVITTDLSYAWDYHHLRVEPGVLLYATFNEPYSAEAALRASYGLGAFRLFTEDYVDLRRARGGYFGNLGLSWESALHGWKTRAFVDVAWATAVFNRAYFGANKAAFDVGELGVATEVNLTDWMVLGLHTELSCLLTPSLGHGLGQSAVLLHGGAFVGFEVD